MKTRSFVIILLSILVTVLAACAFPAAFGLGSSSDQGQSAAVATVSSSTLYADNSSVTSPTFTSSSANPPNIIFILTDDQDSDSIKYMPNLKSLLVEKGTSFSNYFVNVSLCCPSRTTTLRGQYATNTKIIGNQPPQGGFQQVFHDGLEKSTIATWLQQVGYRTMLAGKYLNGYPDKSDPMYIPPGWTEWYSAVKGNAYAEFNYTLNENGKQVKYGSEPEDYGTDVYAGRVIDFVERSSKEGEPFFVYFATYAPHGPATPAPRHSSLFPDALAPRTPSYNEADVSDKPAYIRNLPSLSAKAMTAIDADYRKRLQSLQAVDEAIKKIIDTLVATGQLENTFTFFASDNGFHLGNHRQKEGKLAPYEEEIRVPLIVRGPGVPEGRVLEHVVGNIDLAPTFAGLGMAGIPDFVDGRSLEPLLRSSAPAPDEWRQAYLIQGGQVMITASLLTSGLDGSPAIDVTDPLLLEPPDPDEISDSIAQKTGGVTPFVGIHTRQYVYVEYSSGERELYDLRADPYELQNLASTRADLVQQLSAHLAALSRCSGVTCRVADQGK